MTVGNSHLDEAGFMSQVIQLARVTGWLVYHTRNSKGSDAGFPDLVLVRDGQVMFWECKRDEGKPTMAQAEWLAALGDSSIVEVGVIRPRDWFHVERELTR